MTLSLAAVYHGTSVQDLTAEQLALWLDRS
jgi:hypothetical protein